VHFAVFITKMEIDLETTFALRKTLTGVKSLIVSEGVALLIELPINLADKNVYTFTWMCVSTV